MKKLVQFPLEGGGSVLLEAEELPGLGKMAVSRGKAGPEVSREKFEAAIEAIRPVANALLERLRGLACPPDRVDVEFGLKLSGSLGVIIASGTTEANFKVALKWAGNRTT